MNRLKTIGTPEMIAFGPPAKDLVDKSEQATLYGIDVQSGETKRLTEERWVWIGKMSWTADNQGLFFLAFRARTGNQLYYLSHPDGEVRRVTSGLGGFGNYGLGITADASTLVAERWESAAQVWTVGVDGKAAGAVRVTTGNADGSYGIAGLTDGRIVYVARAGGEFDLWTVKGDGTESIPLTADPFHDLDIAAAPGGSHLVFSSDRAGGSHIFRAGADGSRPQQLTFGESDDDAPDCSPDGQWVVYASALNEKTTVWKVPISGGTPIQLTDFECVAPSFSPDGQFISCIIPSESIAENASIAVIPAAGGSPVKTFKVVPFAWTYLRARWMPDGQGLVFRKDDKNVSNLWMQGLAGNPPSQLTDFKTDLIYNYAFASDGQHIILARGQLVANVVLIKDFR